MDFITLAHFMLTVTKKKGAPIREPYPPFLVISEDQYYPRFRVWISSKTHPKLHRHIEKYNGSPPGERFISMSFSKMPHMDDDEFYDPEYRWVSKVDENVLWKSLNSQRTRHPMEIPHEDGDLYFGRMCSLGPEDIYSHSPGWHSCHFKSDRPPILSSDGESPDFEWNSSLRRWITRTKWGTIVPQQYDAPNFGVDGDCLTHVDPLKFPSMSEAKELIESKRRIHSNKQTPTFCTCTRCDWTYDRDTYFVQVNGVPCKLCYFHWDTCYGDIYNGMFVCSEKGCKKGRFENDDDDEHFHAKTTRFLCSECYAQTSKDVSQYIELDGAHELY